MGNRVIYIDRLALRRTPCAAAIAELKRAAAQREAAAVALVTAERSLAAAKEEAEQVRLRIAVLNAAPSLSDGAA